MNEDTEKALEYLDEWIDETNRGELDEKQSTNEFRYQLLKQLILLNQHIGVMCAVMMAPYMREDDKDA